MFIQKDEYPQFEYVDISEGADAIIINGKHLKEYIVSVKGKNIKYLEDVREVIDENTNYKFDDFKQIREFFLEKRAKEKMRDVV